MNREIFNLALREMIKINNSGSTKVTFQIIFFQENQNITLTN